MDEELDIWFDNEILYDTGLDEYLTELFKEVDKLTESNVNNFAQFE
jgi:hypothetical protein